MIALTHEELVGMVSNATNNVFATMLGLKVSAADAYLSDSATISNNGVVSFIGLAGPLAGTGSISCTARCACHIASCLMMSEFPAVDDDVLDSVAEVTNMIIGNVKTDLERRLGPMGLSIPIVIHGRNFSSRTAGKQEWTIVPFLFDGETLSVQLFLEPKKD